MSFRIDNKLRRWRFDFFYQLWGKIDKTFFCNLTNAYSLMYVVLVRWQIATQLFRFYPKIWRKSTKVYFLLSTTTGLLMYLCYLQLLELVSNTYHFLYGGTDVGMLFFGVTFLVMFRFRRCRVEFEQTFEIGSAYFQF